MVTLTKKFIEKLEKKFMENFGISIADFEKAYNEYEKNQIAIKEQEKQLKKLQKELKKGNNNCH